MKVLDVGSGSWYLLEGDKKLYFDCNCSHSAFGYSWMIELNFIERILYHLYGRDYLNKLANSIHQSAPILKCSTSKYKNREVTVTAEMSEAMKAWRDSKHSVMASK